MRLMILAFSFFLVSLSPFCAYAIDDTEMVTLFNGRWVSQDRKTLITFDLENNRMEEQDVSGGEPSVSTVSFFSKNKPNTIKKNVLLHEEAVYPKHSSSYTLNDENHFSKMDDVLPGQEPKARHYTRLGEKESLNADTPPWSWVDSLPRWNKKGDAPFTYSGEDRTIRFTDPGAIAFCGAERFPVYMIMSQVGYGPDLLMFALDHEKGGFALWLTKQADKEWDAIIINRKDQDFDLGTLVEAE